MERDRPVCGKKELKPRAKISAGNPKNSQTSEEVGSKLSGFRVKPLSKIQIWEVENLNHPQP